MTELEIYLDHWHISKTDGTFILNGKYSDYIEGLKRLFEKERIDTLDQATKAVALLKVGEKHGQFRKIKTEVLEQLLSIEKRLREIEASLEGIPQVSQLNGQKIAYEHVLKLLDVHAEYQTKMAEIATREVGEYVTGRQLLQRLSR